MKSERPREPGYFYIKIYISNKEITKVYTKIYTKIGNRKKKEKKLGV